MRTDEEIYDEKRKFVHYELTTFIQAIDKNISRAEYHVIANSSCDMEYIIITWYGGSSKRVYVTGSGLLQLSVDVLRAIK